VTNFARILSTTDASDIAEASHKPNSQGNTNFGS
jgi:hypothetical protein